MKISKEELNKIIFEEINLMIENGDIDEGVLDRLRYKTGSALGQVGGRAKALKQRALGGIAGVAGEEEEAASLRSKAADTKAGAKQASRAKAASKLFDRKLDKMLAIAKDLENDMKQLGLMDDRVMASGMNSLAHVMRKLKERIPIVATTRAQSDINRAADHRSGYELGREDAGHRGGPMSHEEFKKQMARARGFEE
jgi:hypothetical protein